MTFRSVFAWVWAPISRYRTAIPPLVTEPTARRFVLFLRPSDTGSLARLDAIVARAAAGVAQVVAVGAPPFACGPFTAGDFRRMSERALVILLPSRARPGLEWELEKLAKSDLLSKCLVFDPGAVSEHLEVSTFNSAQVPLAVERLRSNLAIGAAGISHEEAR